MGNILTFWSGGSGGGGGGGGSSTAHHHSNQMQHQRPALMKIGEATALPVMLCGLLEGQWAYQQHKLNQMDELELDGDADADDDDDDGGGGNSNPSAGGSDTADAIILQQNSLLHPNRSNSGPESSFRDKITPKFCRKNYTPLVQNYSDTLFRFRRSSNCRA